MANQTNVIVNPSETAVTVTLATVATVIPARSKTADAGVTATDAEWVTIMALGNLFVCKASPTSAAKYWASKILKNND